MERVSIIGSGNWGSAISRIIGHNVKQQRHIFNQHVRMWVFEEIIEGRPLSQWINDSHTNPKYLPGFQLPDNIVAEPDLLEAVRDATLLIFVIPHQFVKRTCERLKGNILPAARAISLIKGVDTSQKGLTLISEMIHSILNIDVSVLMGANIANEVAMEQFCESTIGCRNKENGQLFQILFDTKYFRVNMIEDITSVELCGALKNIVAIAAGTVDGLKLGENTKAAVIRIGLVEMKKFCESFFDGIRTETFFESCGVADLITTCFGGRNRKLAEAHVLTGKSFEELEVEMLNGQKLQGTLTSKEVYELLVQRQLTKEFPLFVAVYELCYENLGPKEFVDFLSTWSYTHHSALVLKKSSTCNSFSEEYLSAPRQSKTKL